MTATPSSVRPAPDGVVGAPAGPESERAPAGPVPAGARPGEPTTAARVVRMTLQAEGVASIELRTADGAPWPAWTPGSHVDLLLPSGTVRQYSLCGDPADRTTLRIAVLRQPAGRGGSVEVHDTVRLGQELPVRGPRNAFPWAASPACTFVAGGIGITPILAMVRAAHDAGCDWRLLYGGRSRASMAFLDELAALPAERVEVVCEDEAGRIDLERVAALGADGPVYCCGPSGLLEALEARFAADGRADALHLERFAPAAVPAATADGRPAGALRVVLARSGVTIDVPPEQTVLDAIRAAGVDAPSSCEQGICGTCECGVLAGTPDHRDAILTPGERAAGTVMMPCVSRAVGDALTLDL